jgi:aminoglycoside phosphotransferase (APT) family kinase protein
LCLDILNEIVRPAGMWKRRSGPGDTLGRMDDRAAWPAALTEQLHRMYGIPRSVERLGGMSVAAVYRVRFAGGSVVVKVSAARQESLFYERVAPRLRPMGIPIPALEWSAEAEGRHWLVLEDIPAPLPVAHGEAWAPDPRMVAVLARLHVQDLDVPASLFVREEWRWTDAMTDGALSFFPRAQSRELAAPLRALQDEAQHLSEEQCWIAGDPNPSNWGVRRDGSLTLFDWELFRRGTPPVDLAIIVAGLGDVERYEQVAACYIDCRHDLNGAARWPPQRLARDIALAKVWSVAALLSRLDQGESRVPDTLRAYLAEHIPPWIRGL